MHRAPYLMACHQINNKIWKIFGLHPNDAQRQISHYDFNLFEIA